MNISLIDKLYDYFENVTPLTVDCGKLCNKKCCNGSDEDGMILFPGELEKFSSNENFHVYYDENYKMHAVRCNGYCNRNERPLSCRIFPFMFYMNNEKEINTAPDIRAIDFCPVLTDNQKINKKFLRTMRIAARLISSDEQFTLFIKDMTELLTDFNKL